MKKIKSALAYIGVAIFLAGCTPTPQPDLKVGKLVPADAVMCEETTEFMKYSVTRVGHLGARVDVWVLTAKNDTIVAVWRHP